MHCQGNRAQETYGLAPMQQGMLFNSLLAPHSGVDIEQIVLELRESLEVAAFTEAWRRSLQRHAVLRTSFHWEGLPQPLQAVHREVRLPLVLHDWGALTRADQMLRLEALLQAERQRGFELEQPPLLRLVLCRLGPSDFRLLWTFTHALLDGRSFTQVLREVFALYEALRQGRAPKLAPVRPYRDYIEWLARQDGSKAESYWRSLLEGFTTPTPLVIDQGTARESGEATGYGEHFLALPAALTGALERLAAHARVTLNTVVQGAWALLLSRYSGETDVVFGAVRAGRKSTIPGAETMVGLFLNTLPVRVRVAPEATLAPWLQQVREQHLRVREHEHTPLLQVQQWSQVPASRALFESLVVFERATLDSTLRAQGGAWLNRRFRVVDQTNYPLTLFAYAEPELLFKLSYDRKRLEGDAVARLGSHLKTLLEGMAAQPQQPLGRLPLLPAAERHQVLVEWNRTEQVYPTRTCLHDAIEARAQATPEAVALVCEAGQLTYAQLNARADRLAGRLQELGVGPEVLVGVCLEPSLELVVGLLAVLKAGGAYVPLDPAYPPERLAFMLEDAQAPLVLTQPAFLAFFAGGRSQVLCLDPGLEDGADGAWPTPIRQAGPENLAYVLYTSGSTGQPKGVMVTHRNVVNFFAGMDQRLDRQPGVWLAVTSIAFDISVLELFWTLARGFKVVLQRREQNLAGALARQINRHGVTHLQCTPSLAELLVREAEAKPALRSLRQLLLGGEALTPALVRQLDLPGQILNLYGPTETTVWSTTHEVAREAARVPIGRPIANTEIYILDCRLQPAPIGVPGELFIGGAGVARGYFRRQELTAERFIPHPFKAQPEARLYRTGDRARYLPDGTIEFLGRLDHQVKLRGYRIEPGEIESALRQHPAVRECAVVARELAPRDTRLVAYVVPAAAPAPAGSDLRTWLHQKLPDFMVPAAYVLLKALPLTPNGKLDRQALPAPETQPAPATAAPRSALEKHLAQIWRRVLGLEEIGIHDNFFERGGHSLLATQLVSQVRASLDKTFSVVQLYQHPTIHALARKLSPPPSARSAANTRATRSASRKPFHWPRRAGRLPPAAPPGPEPLPAASVGNRNPASASPAPEPAPQARLPERETEAAPHNQEMHI